MLVTHRPRAFRGLAQTQPRVAVPPGQAVVLVEQRTVNAEVIGVLGSAIVSAASLLLFALGKNKAGYMLGIAAAITGGVVGAVRLIGERSS